MTETPPRSTFSDSRSSNRNASLGYLGAISTFHGKRPSAFEGDDLLRLANWVAERIFRDDWNRIPARSSLDRLAPQEAPS